MWMSWPREREHRPWLNPPTAKPREGHLLILNLIIWGKYLQLSYFMIGLYYRSNIYLYI